ncbi:AAA family ATPase [Pseudomonas putida]|uniref:AAA family ATPase n=1 Tax=Pseudomonas putida TaxID=303 RepID=UPI0018D8EEC6|nr:AAA family ATPase [Pseudomonas putida]
MITRIKKLKNFGIFRDYNGDSIQTFGKFNLIYGWNGSGKSTLSKLFESLEKRRNLQATADSTRRRRGKSRRPTVRGDAGRVCLC